MRPFALVTLLLVGALASCRDATAPIDQFHPASIGVLEPLSLTTTVSPAELAPGDSITMTITITNVSNSTVNAVTTACASRFVITGPTGDPVDRGNPICTLELGIKALAPGQSVSLTEHWDGMELVGGDVVARAPAGQYIVRGNGFTGRVRSNTPAVLTVLPGATP